MSKNNIKKSIREIEEATGIEKKELKPKKSTQVIEKLDSSVDKLIDKVEGIKDDATESIKTDLTNIKSELDNVKKYPRFSFMIQPEQHLDDLGDKIDKVVARMTEVNEKNLITTQDFEDLRDLVINVKDITKEIMTNICVSFDKYTEDNNKNTDKIVKAVDLSGQPTKEAIDILNSELKTVSEETLKCHKLTNNKIVNVNDSIEAMNVDLNKKGEDTNKKIEELNSKQELRHVVQSRNQKDIEQEVNALRTDNDKKEIQKEGLFRKIISKLESTLNVFVKNTEVNDAVPVVLVDANKAAFYNAGGGGGGGFDMSTIEDNTQPSKVPVIHNVTMTNANVEYSQLLSNNTRKVDIKLRANAILKIAFAAGASGTTYITVSYGASLHLENVNLAGITLYFQSPSAAQTAEILAWT